MNECPLENKCLTKNVVYMATVESEGTEYKYIGATGGGFKSRWRNHMLSFRRINMRHCTSLANTVHTIKVAPTKSTVSPFLPTKPRNLAPQQQT